jgi:hypothetical protein
MEGRLDELHEFLKFFVHRICEHTRYVMIKTVNKTLKYRELKFLKNMMIETPMHMELWTQEL